MELQLALGKEAVSGSFDEFFRAYFAKVVRAAALVTGDASGGQDQAQEAFLKLYQRWDGMQSEDHARNFVFKVALNRARSHRRAHLRLVRSGVRDAGSPESVDESRDDWLEVTRALAGLSPRQRACVVLVDYVDMDSQEAGRALGIAPATVRIHLMRGRQALREALGLAPVKDEGR